MRIERVKTFNIPGLEDDEWKLPLGPVLLFFETKMLGNILIEVITEVLYGEMGPSQKSQNSCVELWLEGVNNSLHVTRYFSIENGKRGLSSSLIIEDESGARVSLPEKMSIGEYIFHVDRESFSRGNMMEWPVIIDGQELLRSVNNIQRGGEEKLSLVKVRASLTGAQKKLEEQKESIAHLKAEYDALRFEWDTEYRRQEEERMRLIEIKSTKEREEILVQKIMVAEKIQERITLLRENPDYRELRVVKGDLNCLNDRSVELKKSLSALTIELQVDWAMIDSMHEECIEWARLQSEVQRLATQVQNREQQIQELNDLMAASGYLDFREEEDQRMIMAEELRCSTQEELLKLEIIRTDLSRMELLLSEEKKRFKELDSMSEVSETDERKIEQMERHLAKWKKFKVGSHVDSALKSKLGWKSIDERLSLQLANKYRTYQILDYEEFRSRLKLYREQKLKVDGIQKECRFLQQSVSGEEKLRRINLSRSDFLSKAFSKVNVLDLQAWLVGWTHYKEQKAQLELLSVLLKNEVIQYQNTKDNLDACAQQLREKLEIWGTPATNREEVLATVLNVAGQLREKEEVEQGIVDLTSKYKRLLGDRKMERLEEKLEPLSDLEREMLLTDEKRREELDTSRSELTDIRRQLVAKKPLYRGKNVSSLTSLEKKMEGHKKRLKSYEDLQWALEDALDLLEITWQEWKNNNANTLENEARWISDLVSPPPSVAGKLGLVRDGWKIHQRYFAYKMAGIQLSLDHNSEVPFCLIVSEINEDEEFWHGVISYLSKLSLSKQVMLITTDKKLQQMLALEEGWQISTKIPS